MRPLRPALAAGLALLFALGGCSGDEQEAKSDVLLDRADVAPLKPSQVRLAYPGDYVGSQYYGCSDNDGVLQDAGWSFEVRTLSNTDDSWSLYSAVLDNPKGSASDAIAGARTQLKACNRRGSNLVEFDPGGNDTFAYRSVTPEGRVDTVRAYAAIGDTRLVQLTLFGLKDQDAPDGIKDLLRTAVAKAD